MTKTLGRLLLYVGVIMFAVASFWAPNAIVTIGLLMGALGTVLGAPQPRPSVRRIEHAGEIVEFPDTIGRVLQGDLVVLAPRPKANPRHGADEDNLFIVAHSIGGSALRTVVSLATGETFALPPDRRCCRVDVQLKVTIAVQR